LNVFGCTAFLPTICPSGESWKRSLFSEANPTIIQALYS